MADIKVSLLTAMMGGKVIIPTIDGDVEMAVPPGTQPGDRKTLRKRGLPRVVGRGKSDDKGDQWVTLKVEVPKTLTSAQKELLLQAFSPPNAKPKGSEKTTSADNKDKTTDDENKKEGDCDKNGGGIFSSLFGGKKSSRA